MVCNNLNGGEIGGTVWEDFNYNGVQDETTILGVAGVQVNVTGCDGAALGTTYTDASGNWVFDISAAPSCNGCNDVQIEYIMPETVACWAKVTQAGTDNGTMIQFVGAGDCASMGIADPNAFCDLEPPLVLNCYLKGDPFPNPMSISATGAALVSFPYDSQGDGTSGANAPSYDATNLEIGTTWGIAYDKTNQIVYAAAFAKRHVGFGPLGEGGIYAIDYSSGTPVVSNFVDVNTIGINTGQIGVGATIQDRHMDRGLTADPINPDSGDPLAFDAVGKVSLGDIDYDESTGILYVVNLFDQTLNAIVVDSDNDPATPPTAADVTTYPIPSPCGAGEGTARPFATKVWKGSVYVGLVCDAAQAAYVYQFQNGTFTSVMVDGVAEVPLDYRKGNPGSTSSCIDPSFANQWNPWTATFPTFANCGGGSSIIPYYPTPILSDIEFDLDGSMILGFLDRTAVQIGWNDRTPDGMSFEQTFSAGDILRVCNVNGDYILEGGAGCVNNANNNQGPSGGEYYPQDNAGSHDETSIGGLALVPGTGEVVNTSFRGAGSPGASSGVNWFDNITGTARNPSYYVYTNTTIGTLGKAQGLGDVEALCEAAPLEIGNYVWEDLNENGLQDACEPGFDGVTVELIKDGNVIASTLTANGGQYYFSNSSASDPNLNWTGTGADIELLPDMTYTVRISNAEGNAQQMPLLGYALTEMDANTNNSDKIDNDAASDGTNASITITLGDAGCNDHTLDFGFFFNCEVVITDMTQSMCDDNGTNLFTFKSDDDFFTLSPINATNVGAGVSNTFEVVLGCRCHGRQWRNGYWEQYLWHSNLQLEMSTTPPFEADGSTIYTITVRDADIPSCFSSFVTTPIESCSNCPEGNCRGTIIRRNRGTGN